MVVATVTMLRVREQIDQVHVVLVYLLIILGASAAGGRLLAFPLAGVGYLLIDYYFQRPYGEFINNKPLDWLALGSYLLTAGVATQLLARAQAEAEESRRREIEVASLARLGSETLSAGRAEDALVRIAEVIRTTLGMSRCVISANIEEGAGAVVDGRRDEPIVTSADPVEKIVIPLAVQGRMVGSLRLESDSPVSLDPAQRRFLDAITYYAALALDRVRLVAEAEHAEALREADRLKDIVLASVSHDLRTPLTTIKALAQSEALQGNESGAAIEEQADRLTRLVSDLLDLSRLKGGGFAAKPELNTADDLIGAAVRQTKGLFANRSLRTVIDLASPTLVGHFDFSQSLRVLCNLLENALRYSPAVTTRLVTTSSIIARTTSSCRVRSRCSSSTTSRSEHSIRSSSRPLSRASRLVVARTRARCSAERRPRCREFTRRLITIWRASSSVTWMRTPFLALSEFGQATCSLASRVVGCTPMDSR